MIQMIGQTEMNDDRYYHTFIQARRDAPWLQYVLENRVMIMAKVISMTVNLIQPLSL